MARAGASFELDRLELVDGRLVVRGWWFGVRGVRFVRPALIVEDRQTLATLEHKPWVAAEDGGWIAAFPWKRRGLDVRGVTLVVAPSIEVPLDRHAEPVEPAPPVAPELELVPAAPAVTVVKEVREPLRDELGQIERQLDAMHAELHDARAVAAERAERCRELEQAVARERRVASESGTADEEVVRAHAMAVLDRDRALAQHAEAVNDREAAVRARKRMERQRDEAVAACADAEARRDQALAERDDARKQRDDLLLAHQALNAQLKGSLADAVRSEPARRATPRPAPAVAAGAKTAAGPPLRSDVACSDTAAGPSLRADAARTVTMRPVSDDLAEKPLGVRTIPAARAVAASLHRSHREREHGVTRYDMWAIRVLGSVAALAFISLLVMILKAFFVF